MLVPMNANIMEKIYEIFCGSGVLYGVEVWVVKREREIIDKFKEEL